MNLYKLIIRTLKEKEQLSLVLQTFFLIAITFIARLGRVSPGIAFPFLFLILAAFIVGKKAIHNKWIWLAIFFILFSKIVESFYSPANHHFLLMFSALLLFHVLWQPEEQRVAFLARNAKWLIVVVLFFVSLQKLMAPSYMNGEFFTYMLMRGHFFVPIPVLQPDYAEWSKQNLELLYEVRALIPGEENCISFSVEHPQIFSIAGKALSYFVLFIETAVCFIIALSNRQKLVHTSLLILVTCILLARPECGFLSILCGLGLSFCPPQLSRLRLAYLFFIVLFSSLIMMELVYY